jgi:hypothetical protein
MGYLNRLVSRPHDRDRDDGLQCPVVTAPPGGHATAHHRRSNIEDLGG